MNCRRIRKRLAAYQDGEIGEEERDRVSTHLQGCPSCRSCYAELEQVWQSLGKIQEIKASREFDRRLSEKINAVPESRLRRRFPWVFQWFPAPAMVFILLLMGIALGAYMGKLLMESSARHVVSLAGNSPESTGIYSFSAFAAVPPGTLGDGYLRMANFTEDRRK